MSPDSDASRISRLEERVDSNRRQIEMFGPLPLQVGLVQKGLEDLAEDLKAARRDEARRFERFERDVDERIDKFEARQEKQFDAAVRSFENQVLACKGSVDAIATSFKEWQDKQTDRKDQSTLARLSARYGAVTALMVVLISSITSLVIAFFGGP